MRKKKLPMNGLFNGLPFLKNRAKTGDKQSANALKTVSEWVMRNRACSLFLFSNPVPCYKFPFERALCISHPVRAKVSERVSLEPESSVTVELVPFASCIFNC